MPQPCDGCPLEHQGPSKARGRPGTCTAKWIGERAVLASLPGSPMFYEDFEGERRPFLLVVTRFQLFTW